MKSRFSKQQFSSVAPPTSTSTLTRQPLVAAKKTTDYFDDVDDEPSTSSGAKSALPVDDDYDPLDDFM